MNTDIQLPPSQIPAATPISSFDSSASPSTGVQIGSPENFSGAMDTRNPSSAAYIGAMQSNRRWARKLKTICVVISLLLMLAGLFWGLKATIFKGKPEGTVPTPATVNNPSEEFKQKPDTLTNNQSGEDINTNKNLQVKGNGTIGGNLTVTGTITAANFPQSAGTGSVTIATGPRGQTGATGPAGPQGPTGISGTASCPNGPCLSLQASSPGVQEAGNINISGTGLFAGNVGIGTSTPSNKLSVAGNADFSGHLAVGNSATVDGGQLLAPGASYKNVIDLEETVTNLNGYSYFEGIQNDLLLNPSGPATATIFGGENSIVTQAGNTQNFSFINAGWDAIDHYGSGTIANARMLQGYVANDGSGTITNAKGVGIQIGNGGSGSITNGFGILINSAYNSGGGTFANNYGIYIQDQSAVGSVNSYNLYSEGANSKNYFAGSVGIGTANPGNLLSIGALTTADASAQIAVTTGGVNNKGIIVQAVAGQNVDLLQAQDSTGAILASIDKVGNLVVKNATINGILTVNGHIITANSSGTTTIAPGAAACSTPTVSLSGNDSSGTITITTGTSCSAGGILGTISFANAYGSAPRVVISADNTNAASLQYFTSNRATTTFELSTNTIPTNSTTYTYNYQVIQ